MYVLQCITLHNLHPLILVSLEYIKRFTCEREEPFGGKPAPIMMAVTAREFIAVGEEMTMYIAHSCPALDIMTKWVHDYLLKEKIHDTILPEEHELSSDYKQV